MPPRFLRLFIAALWLALAACVAPTAPAPAVRVAFPGEADVKDVPLLIALDSMRAAGYQVDTIRLARFDLMPESLANGESDFGSFSPQGGWSAIAQGADLRSVATQFGPLWSFVANQGIETCGDLNGRAIAFGSARGVNQALFQTYVEEHCPGATMNVLLLEESTSRVAALIAGQIDGTVLELEDVMALERQAPGQFHTLVSYTREFPNIQIATYAVRREWAAQHPDTVKDFIRAVLTAHRNTSADPQMLGEEIAARLALDPAQARALGDAYLNANIWDVNGALTPESVQFTLNVLANVEAVPGGLSPADVADLTYLNAVLDEIGRK